MFMNKNKLLNAALISLFGMSISVSSIAQLAPPDVKMVDEFGINIATRQVMASVDTVSIGGKLGLSHNINGESNLFSHIGNYGYQDKYAGTAKYVPYSISSSRLERNGTLYQHAIYIMRVFGPVGSADFMVVDQNGNQIHNASGVSSNYEYVALGDTRHTLEVSPDNSGLIWTTDDGTELYFWGGGHSSTSEQRSPPEDLLDS